MPKGSTSQPARAASAADDVQAFLDALDHPRKAEILALRRIILGADLAIAEGIEWNAPSFRTSEWFATFHLRAKGGVQIDRASATFRDLPDVEAKQSAFAAVIREWIRHV